VVLLADWQPGQAHGLLATSPEALQQEPVLQALEDLSGVLSGRLQRLGHLRLSLPKAITDVKHRLESGKQNKEKPLM
jgi:hypothetical protein